MNNKKIVLQNGQEIFGKSFGYDGEVIAELCFNTSIVGYQEIMSDQSYGGQMLVMTYPIIGSYGINDQDYESNKPAISAFIVNEYIDFPSNFRSTKTFCEELKSHKIIGIEGVDTRMLTKIIRNKGSQKAIITDIYTPTQLAVEKINSWSFPKDIVQKVCRKKAETFTPEKTDYKIVAIDHGIKMNIIRSLVNRNCEVVVLPYGANTEEILKHNPDGLFLSNGPGDPEENTITINLINEIKNKLPIFGICLGHQLIALAYGAKTFKMKFGHRGANHPVKNLLTGKVEMTTQNHSFAVGLDSIKNTGLEITHLNILDNTCEGLQDKENNIFSVQYHPESAAGPEDSQYLFDQFINEIKKFKEKK